MNDSFFRACISGNIKIVSEELNSGIDVNFQYGRNEWTALHYAACYGQPEVVELLIMRGADVNLKSSSGQTPLRLATQYGHSKVADLLLKHNAEISAPR